MFDEKQLHNDRLGRAYLSLDGLSCGDAFGDSFFRPTEEALSLIRVKALPPPPWLFTDDTQMALSIISTLEQHGQIDQDHLAMSFANNYETSRDYGPSMHELLKRIREGFHWSNEAPKLFGGQGSFGNGSAMRVAPLGAYFADDLDTLVVQAERSAAVTHCHHEALAGAIAVALAAAFAWRYRDWAHISHAEFLDQIYKRTPESEVRTGIRRAMHLPSETAIQDATAILGNGWNISAQDTVPFALWSAACRLEDYEEALWGTVTALGDRDTNCAIVGGVVVMHTGVRSIPKRWLQCREPLPQNLKVSSAEPSDHKK